MGETQERKNICQELGRVLKRHCGDEDRVAADIPGLVITMQPRLCETTHLGLNPVVGVIVQGSKSILAGREEFFYQAGQCCLVGFSKPIFNCFFIPSPEQPFLSVALEIDPRLLAELTLEIPSENAAARASGQTFWAGDADLVMLDCFRRLTQLLDSRADIPVLAPLVVREIHYRLLTGKMAGLLKNRQFDWTRTARIARAVSSLKENYKEPLSVPRLAAEANMARSTFHRHFKHVTSMSPLQFQKELRLCEAQKIMVADGVDVNEASRAVGYESASQFIREYKRQFGEPPQQNAQKIRLANLDKMSGHQGPARETRDPDILALGPLS
ncbi:MAG: AraC family transcriptional regulator [Deltaproteobacteria bacterium]|nr:AraC family transcriptional regulator [Deltaproteobacteria bacterium]